jgi:hypothetical protein
MPSFAWRTNGLFSGLAFLLLMLILPDPDLDFRAADHLGAAKSAAIGVMWLIIDFSHHNLFQFCADFQNDSLFSLNLQEKYPSSCSTSLAQRHCTSRRSWSNTATRERHF